MGLDFTPSQTKENVTPAPSVPEEKYDIVLEKKALSDRFKGSEEVDNLLSALDIYDTNSIVNFGASAANEISKASDIVLNSMNLSQLDDTSLLLKNLAEIMDQFEIKDLKEDNGFLSKLFHNAKKQLDKVLAKYNTMGAKVDAIYVELKKYEDEIAEANRNLARMFEANKNYYQELMKYILAGEQGCEELKTYLEQKQREYEQTGDNSLQFELQNLNHALLLLEQRTQDLRIAENVAMQSIPMIKTMEFSNSNLIRKINSAFIITLPVFKQGLAQAVMLKRQKIQAEGLATLDAKTNEMLLKNASNTVEQSKMIAQMAGGSSIKIETLEATWKTIVDGIEETQRIQDDIRRQRTDEKARLEQIKEDFRNRYTAGK